MSYYITKTTDKAPIATFSDGLDNIPTKSLIVTIPPTLSGVSVLNEKQTGRNLLNANDSSYTFQVGYNYRYNCGTVSLKKGVTYTFSALQEDALTSNTRNTIAIGVNEVYTYESATGTNYHNQSGVHSMQYTPSEDCEAVLLVWVHTPSNAVKYSSFMLEYGSTAHDYEPYQTPTQYTADLGRTVYGGQADIVNGTGTENEKGKLLSELSWTQNATFPHVFNGTGFTDRKKGINWNNATCLSDRYTGYTSSEVGTKSEGIALATGATNTTIYVSDDRFETVAEFTASLETDDSFVVLPLETPTDFTFDGQKIPTRLGYNAFWSEQGDTEVTYYCLAESEELYTVTDTTLKNIADAIRTKTERTAPILVEDMDDEILSIVTGGGGGSCERLFYLRCYNNDYSEIPQASSWNKGDNFDNYVSYDSSTRKFTVLQDFTGIVVAWVYTYQTYESSRSDGSFYINGTQMLFYTATGNSAGSTGGKNGVYNFKQGDTFWVYTPTRNGYPQQNCKVYMTSAIDDDVFTFTDEEAT